MYKEITIDGEPCYQKFRAPESIKIVVAGGTAGKVFRRDGKLVRGPARQPDGDLSGLRMIHANRESDERDRIPDAAAAPRLASLAGKTIALLDISKPGGSVFLDRLEQRLRTAMAWPNVIREMKPTFAKPAPPEVLRKDPRRPTR